MPSFITGHHKQSITSHGRLPSKSFKWARDIWIIWVSKKNKEVEFRFRMSNLRNLIQFSHFGYRFGDSAIRHLTQDCSFSLVSTSSAARGRSGRSSSISTGVTRLFLPPLILNFENRNMGEIHRNPLNPALSVL